MIRSTYYITNNNKFMQGEMLNVCYSVSLKFFVHIFFLKIMEKLYIGICCFFFFYLKTKLVLMKNEIFTFTLNIPKGIYMFF